MKQIKFLSLGILFMFMASCNQSPFKKDQLKAQDGWKMLDENDYSIQYPVDWTLDKSGQTGTSFIVLSPLTSSQDQFRENVNLLIQDLTGLNIDLDKYTQISEDQIKRMAINSNLHESSRSSANGINFQKVIYTFDQGIYNLQCEQYYWIRSNKAYVLSLTSETDQFETYKKIGEQVLNSFIFK